MQATRKDFLKVLGEKVRVQRFMVCFPFNNYFLKVNRGNTMTKHSEQDNAGWGVSFCLHNYIFVKSPGDSESFDLF